MELPKYQWFTEQPKSDCGFCDKVLISQNGTDDLLKRFQLNLHTETIDDNFLANNPFDLITSTDLTFVQSFTWAGQLINVTYRQLQLYCEGNVYVINWSITQTDDYVYSQVGNVYYVSILFGAMGSSERIRLRQFLQAVFDVNHGTTTTFDLGTNTMTIANIPSGSYISNYNFVSSINTVTTSTNSQLWMHWNNGRICYLSSTVFPAEVSFTFQYPLTAGNQYIIQIPYNITSLGIQTEIRIFDGVNSTVINPNTTTNSGIITINYTAQLTTTHTIKIELTDVNQNLDGICFNAIIIKKVTPLLSLSIEDCDGNIYPFEYNTETYADSDLVGNEQAIILADQFPQGSFRFILMDEDDRIITSRWYELYDETNCEHRLFYKVYWSNNCKLSEINYPLINGFNELYFSGVMIKQSLELHDSIDNIMANGAKISIYKNTQQSFELRLHPYLSDTMDMIERIFDHNIIKIEDVDYNATDVFKVSELNYGVYTGRIDLLKSDSAVISSKCCC